MTYMLFKSQVKRRSVYIGNFRCEECNYNVNVETSNKFYIPKCKICNKPMKEVY